MLITKHSFPEFIFKRAAKKITIGAALVVASIFECPEASAQKIKKQPTTTISTSDKALENKIKKILSNKTWEGNTLKYTFSTGDTMWIKIGDDEYYKGKWKLNGNKLTIINTDKNTSETFKVKIIDKDDLLIGNNKFYYSVDPVD